MTSMLELPVSRPALVSTPTALAELMHKIQSGDQAAFGDLYTLTHRHLRAIIARTVRAADHTAEVIQEVYLYVWEHARSYDPDRGSVLSWLSMISFRRAVDRVRSVTRSTARDHRSLDLDDASVPDVADLGIARHNAARLHRALGQLTSKQREAVSLTYLDGYTHQEAACLLDVPLGTLKTRVRDGVVSLRVQLAGLRAEA